jgi:transposase
MARPLHHIPEPTRQALIKLHELPIAVQSKRIGIAAGTIQNYRSALIQAGLIPPKRRITTASDAARMRRLYVQGYSIKAIAPRVGMNRKHCGSVLRGAMRAETWTANQIKRLFMVSIATVRWWRDRDWLPLVTSDAYTSGSPQRADRAMLARFVHVREAWPSYAPGQISDPALRAIAEHARRHAGGHWASVPELAAAAHLDRDSLTQRLRHGWLADWPQVYYGRFRFVWWADGVELPPYSMRGTTP